jgi:hypothetical protein
MVRKYRGKELRLQTVCTVLQDGLSFCMKAQKYFDDVNLFRKWFTGHQYSIASLLLGEF